MIRSMTAFARAEAETPWGDLAWELRSVNHRYLDIFLRLPEDFRRLENDVRARINQRLARGKVEATLVFKARPGQGGLNLNDDLLDALITAVDTVEARLARPAPVPTAAHLLHRLHSVPVLIDRTPGPLCAHAHQDAGGQEPGEHHDP